MRLPTARSNRMKRGALLLAGIVDGCDAGRGRATETAPTLHRPRNRLFLPPAADGGASPPPPGR